MKPFTFISYSRHCIGFVDDLAHQLEMQGFKTWLDYRSLVPGRPWLEQIHKGLDEAELLLLVVSPESIASKSVEIEWRYYLERKKRIILLILRAVDLPPKLESLEWVDFRGGYRSALKKLFRCIEAPSAPKRPPPQSGFKAPAVIWLAAVLSVFTAIYSLFAVWTLLIPLILFPLPAQILKRNFNIGRVQTALWTLPIALFFSVGLGLEFGFVNPDPKYDPNAPLLYNLGLIFLYLHFFIIPFVSILLLLILRLPAMQRWGKPEATLPKFANIFHPNISKPEPVHFFIDHAPEDGRIAEEIAAELRRYGHSAAEGIESAEEVLVLASRFKTDTEADPEKQVVYPIVVQRTRISEKLSRMQWIDFRKGVRNLDALAQLLPQPARMLAAIGVRPTSGNEGAMPNIVLALVDFLIIAAILHVGSFLSYLLEMTNARLWRYFKSESFEITGLLVVHILSLALTGWLIYAMVNSLADRRGWFASGPRLTLGFIVLFALSYVVGWLGDVMAILLAGYGIDTSEIIFAGIPFVYLLFGYFIVGVSVLVFRRDLRHWFPAIMDRKPPYRT
jgi:hypothetical protein